MSEQPFFLTVAGIAMSFIGFAGLMNALRRGDRWEPMELYQLRVIVVYAVATLFGALLTIPAVGFFGAGDAVRSLGLLMTVVSVALGLGNMRGEMRYGRGAVTRPIRTAFTVISVLGFGALLGTAITAAVPLYELSLILMLAIPAGTFVYVIARIDRTS